ncbi:hypothetical protein N9L47_05560 [Rhodobacteraceae bacterium]|nr:hypothetical protein [Paracoccaceae bacterium]
MSAQLHKVRVILLMALLFQPTAAVANCANIKALARFHDVFVHMVTETGQAQSRAASLLQKTLLKIDAEFVVNTLETTVDQSRLAQLFTTAQHISIQIITGNTPPDTDFLAALDELDWIGAEIRKSGCIATALTDQSENIRLAAKISAQTSANVNTNASFPTRYTPKTTSENLTIIARTLAALVSTFCLVYVLSKTRRLRVLRLNRMPRAPIALKFDLIYSAPDSYQTQIDVTALDASMGGMKLKVSKPLPDGAALLLSLPIGQRSASVVWANSYFAGIMFDTELSDTDLKALTSTQRNGP